MSYHCPKCKRVLYDRRLKHCGFCGATIPDEFRFTPEESAALGRKATELDAKRKQREQEATAKAAEEAKVIARLGAITVKIDNDWP